jgi:hypothetical protein
LVFKDRAAKRRLVKLTRRIALPAALVLATLAGGGALYAQLEGGDRGIPPIDSASTLEVTGIEVDTAGKTADDARLAGWKLAQANGWKKLWSQSTGRPINQAPGLAEGVLNSMVSGIIVENEQIGPTRYIARLGVLFDRARANALLGGGGAAAALRSAPFLVIPVMQTGASFQSYESRNEWLRAWNQFRTGGSAIDYVRTSGMGSDPMLLNVHQTRRPGRGWWRMILDTYGAADVLTPEVHLKRTWPGGPAIATFTARFSPDNRVIDRFTLRVERSELIPRMFAVGVQRMDAIYTRALASGLLAPDPSLVIEVPELLNRVAEEIERASARASGAGIPAGPPPPPQQPAQPVPIGSASAFTIQVETPTAAIAGQAELSVSRIPGVTSALTTSLAVGGTSVVRVTFVGEGAALAAALQAQGWNVAGSGSNIRISRPGAAPAATPQSQE